MFRRFRILSIMNFHQHEGKRRRISEFLADDGVQVGICFRSVIGRVDEDLGNFGRVDWIWIVHKPYYVLAGLFVVYDIAGLVH